ncbi:MAG: hypothetical protein IKC09_09770 [Oscillospiraceae bacterium]|nr:hypothetical protein [Oscillospiraceae bacterium]
MTREDQILKKDRMLYTKDTLSANLVLAAIVLDALYFVSIYNSDVGTYYYNWVIGASIIYNLLFMLGAFLASEGVKNRKNGYSVMLILLGLMQIGRVFYLPTMAHEAVVTVKKEELVVMGDEQFYFVVACLVISGICCCAAAVTSYINNKTLADYVRSNEKQSA